MAVSNALSTARSTHAGADPVPAMAAVDTAHEPSGKADHAQVHHHEQQDERDRDEEELLAVAARQRPRHGRRFQVRVGREENIEREEGRRKGLRFTFHNVQ